MVTKIENILTESTYKKIFTLINSFENNDQIKFRSNRFMWPKDLRSNTGVILIYDLYIENVELFKLIKSDVEQKIDRNQYEIDHCLLYFYFENSYIQWHEDGKYFGALSIYLNEEWDADWGGYFMYEEDNEIKALKPSKNLGVLQEGGVNHCVSAVTSNNIPRISLQMFIRKLKDKTNNSLI